MQSSNPTTMEILMLLPLMLHMMPTTNNRLTEIHHCPRNDSLPMLRVTQAQPRSAIVISRGSIFSMTSPPGNRWFVWMHISTASIWCSEFSESSYFALALCLHTMLRLKQWEEGEVPQSEHARQMPVWETEGFAVFHTHFTSAPQFLAARCSRFSCTFCACAWRQQLNPSASLLLRHKGTKVTIKWRRVWSSIVSQWLAGLATLTQAIPPAQQQSLVPVLPTILPTRWVDALWRAALSLRAKVPAVVDVWGTTGLRKVPIGTRAVIFIYDLDFLRDLILTFPTTV